jgi:Domain of unknown function (DUF4384)
MKKIRYWLMIGLMCWAGDVAAQTEAQKRAAALSVKEAINDLQSSLGALLGSPPHQQDQAARNRNIATVNAYMASNCRVANDIFGGSSILDWGEYFRRIPVDFPEGLMFEIELKNATFGQTFKSATRGFLVEVYAQKSLSGSRRNGEMIDISNRPCRIGVYLNALGNSSAGCKIAFIDNDISGQGNTFSLNDGKTPYDYKTLNETLATVAEQLNAEIQRQDLKKVQLNPLTYEQQEVVDDFSIKATTALRQELSKINPTLQITASSRSWKDDNTVIKGGYQIKGNFVEFVAQLADPTNKPIGKPALDRLLPKNLAPNETVIPTIAPPVLAEVKQIKQDLNQVKEPLPNVATLKFSIATNRGLSGLLFEENDTMRLSVRANKACYVRLVYRMANGQLALLRNHDFKINEYALDQWTEIPEDFVCAAPFGAEFLVAYASTEMFDPLKIHEKDGYVIIDTPLNEIKKTSTARAFRNAGVSVVERQLPIVTRARK